MRLNFNDLVNIVSIGCRREADERIIENLIFSKIIYYLAHKRCTFKLHKNQDDRVCSYMSATFAPSGSGKDFSYSVFEKKIGKLVEDEIKKYFDEGFKTAVKKSEGIALENTKEHFKGQSNPGTPQFSAIYKDYKEQLSPRHVIKEFGKCTPEAIVSQRQALMEYNSGSAYFRNSEFGSILENKSSQNEECMEKLCHAYEEGRTEATALKSDKRKFIEIEWIPQQVYVHCSLGIFAEQKSMQNLMFYLEQYMARRFNFVFIQDDIVESLEEMNDRSIKATQELVNYDFDGIAESFYSMYKEILPNSQYTFTIECQNEIDRLKTFFKRESKLETNRLIKLEIASRMDKAQRICLALQFLKDQSSYVIDIDVLNEAMKFIYKFANSFKEMIMFTANDKYAEMFKFFIKRKDEQISNNALRNAKIFDKNFFKQDMETFIDYAIGWAETIGCIFEIKTLNHNMKNYCLKQKEKE